MNFNPMKWKSKNFTYCGLSFLGIYLLFIHKWNYNFLYETVVKNTEPQHVWEFVSDFNNMMKLNPTIEKFNILDESGNYNNWKYSVEYTEHLSHIPLIRNVAYGHFSIKPKTNAYLIESEHRTCFFMGIGCLISKSEFTFQSKGKDTKCLEKIDYECPLFFAFLCRKEIIYQRQEIFKNLHSFFPC